MPTNPQDLNQQELQKRAHADLSKRARGGILIYLLAWLIISLPSAIHETYPRFFYLNTGIMALIMLMRIAHIFASDSLGFGIRKRWLVWGILAGALHWGLLTAWVLVHPGLASIEIEMIVSAAVFGIAGTAALSIEREIRFLYSPFTMGPLFITLVARGGVDDLIFASMAILAVSYVIVTAKTASKDYWHAIGNEQLAELHAQEMERLSNTDQLTQLNNRAFFERRFGEEWKRGSRQNSQLSILMIDLDHFKALNDNHGHVFGDHCLQAVASVLMVEKMRETDILARFGGEEFVVILPDTDADSAAWIAERLRVAVAGCRPVINGETVAMTCSIGGATMVPNHYIESRFLLEQADAALYSAKAQGRNRYVAANVESVESLHPLAQSGVS